MRQLISGLVAAVAVMTVGAVPAMACGGGLFQSSCSPCGAYVSPCAQSQAYVEPVYSGCNTGCGGWAHERLPEPEQQYYPVHQYYYADQGPTYSGPGNFAPYRTYQEGGYGGYHHRPYYGGYHRSWHHTGYGYGAHRGYGYHHGYAHHYAPHHYGYGYHHEHVLRRYY